MKKHILLGLALSLIAFPNILKAEETVNEQEKTAFNNLTNIYANSIFENANLINNFDDNLIFDHDVKNKFFVDTIHDTGFINRKNVKPFHKYTTINKIGGTLTPNKELVIGLEAYYSKQINSYTDGGKYNADQFGGTIAASRIVPDFNNITNKLTISYNDAKLTQPIKNGNDSSTHKIATGREKAIITTLTSSYTHQFHIEGISMRIKPFVVNNLNLVIAYDSETNGFNEDSDKSKTTDKNNYIVANDYIAAGLLVENGVTETVTLTNKLRAGGLIPIGYFERSGKLKGTDVKYSPTELDKFNIDYTLGVKAKLHKNVEVEGAANIDAHLRFGLGATLNIVF